MHIAVCDDNVADRKQLERQIKRESDKRAASTGIIYSDSFGNSTSLLSNPMQYDAFYIDMCLTEGITGTEVANALIAQGVNAPIVPGIMPITNYSRLARFSETCGAEIPRWILLKLAGYGDDVESIKAFGEEVVAQLCERLIQLGAPSLHFYTLNNAAPTLAVLKYLQ